ncbi:gliding motility protein GldM [Flavobacterium sp. TMP13]|uniref:type IX secretion system motor protein PorM/GldM n=1 Tax=Flavobacterium sp. TMP13 TaxID=3425950 RepID=UPI003D77BA8E
MAGGKLTPRQKMINLMYLVFIAMLAMNMSKEVLSAFGLMNEKFESTNTSATRTNEQSLAALDLKATENAAFQNAAAISHKVSDASKKFYTFLGGIKADASEGTKPEDATNYESMDKAENLDNALFVGEGYTPRGTAFMTAMETYKKEMKSALSESKYSSIVKQIDDAFNTSDVVNKDKVKVKFLDYHFQGFPQIASLAKLSAWQNDVVKFETDVINQALGKAAVDESSYSKFEAIVVLDKNAYFQGEKVTGKVVLGKYDPNAKFSDFKGPGQLVNGQAVLSMTAGGVGEQNIDGSFNFMEDGKPINLPFKGKYVVVPRPNSATISADKMNVVYRGVVNPISVSFAGVDANKIVASAPGLSAAGSAGKYNMSPGSGTETTISVTGTLPNGEKVTDKKTFRIKGIPSPTGTIRGEMGVVTGPKSNLEVATIGAKLLDFDFEVGLDVIGFNFKIAGQPTVVVQGNKINAQCKSALSRAGRGDQVTISEIKTKLVGAGSYLLPRTAPVIFEIQ